MQYPEKELIAVLRAAGVDFTASLPCEKIKGLIELLGESFFHVPLTREEEGVGICAGAALAGKRPAIFLQSSGLGNMLNALLSLTGFYRLPLALFISRRGVYKERIEAQLPMGVRLPGILQGAGIPFSEINAPEEMVHVSKRLEALYGEEGMHAFLLSPAVWEGSECGTGNAPFCAPPVPASVADVEKGPREAVAPLMSRFEIIEAAAPYLEGKAVVSNLGWPSKELYAVKDQPSNFYMLGSMGMATPIGLGISLSSGKEVIVIDGDGSILMNPGTLATAAHFSPRNLTILAIDNGSYGSTGNQPTLTGSCVDLGLLAGSMGIREVSRVSGREELGRIMEKAAGGMRFIHAIATPGNRDVPNIPVHHLEIRKRVQKFLGRP